MLFGTQRINSKGHLEIGGCDAVELAQRFGTPLYVIDEAAFRDRCTEYVEAFSSRTASEGTSAQIAFASKAFLSKAAAKLAHEQGLHLDVASLGEMLVVHAAGVDMSHVTLHGNFKKDEDLEAALELQVGMIALDSFDECKRLSELAVARGTKQRSIIRVVPGIAAHELEKIITGQNDSKFGINIENGEALDAAKLCLELPGIELVGFHAHIGSQILDVSPFETLADVMMGFCADVKSATGWMAQLVVCGGGLGIHYKGSDDPPSVKTLAETIVGGVRRAAEERDLAMPTIGVEPGRSIIGESGTTLYEVGPIKTVPLGAEGTRTYVAVDGGLSDNPRPAMYGSEYPVLLANRAAEDPDTTVRISGRHCETDTLFPAIKLPNPRTGDVVAVLSTGAYNHTMASNYNFFYRPAVVFVSDGEAREVVRRETQDDLTARDVG
jgi:diaminopimelate decarboxylase